MFGTAGAVAYFIYEYWYRWRGGTRDRDYLSRITDITDRLAVPLLLVHFFVFFQGLPPGQDVWCAFAREEGFQKSIERRHSGRPALPRGPSSPSVRPADIG